MIVLHVLENSSCPVDPGPTRGLGERRTGSLRTDLCVELIGNCGPRRSILQLERGAWFGRSPRALPYFSYGEHTVKSRIRES